MFRKIGTIQRIILIFCVILVINGMIVGTAFAADRNVIIGFKQSDIPTKEKLVYDNGGKLKKTFHLINAVSANMSDENITKLKKDPRVAYIEDDAKFNMTVDEYNNSWGVQHIGSQLVYNNGFNGTGIKIAVLDTGIDYNHEDLKNNYKGGFDFANNDSDPWDDSCVNYAKTCHGTHVSGIIAAEHNGIGVVGVAPGASLYAVKVLDGGGFGNASWIISGLQWAVDNHMNIATMSLAGSNNVTSLHDAVDNAYNSGVLLVAAAGNTGGTVQYPALYDSVIAVSATDANDQIASWSSRGPKIELTAPGVNIYSTKQNGGYGNLSGTSQATPHVTGVAALIFGNVSDINGDGLKNNIDVRLTLQNTAKHLGISGRNDFYGYGLVDAPNAVGISSLPPSDTTPPVITVNGLNPVNITVGTTYTDAGAIAVDDIDGPVTVSTTGTVDPTTVGTYTITYTATDKSGNTATATRIVNVIPPIDTTPPVITVNGSNTVTITVGSTYTDAGATAVDVVDGPVPVVTTGSVNTNVVGTYTLTYTATDNSGNIATAKRTVNVVKPVLTTITVSPSSVIVPKKRTQIFSAIAKDQLGNPMSGIRIIWSSSITTIGTVNPMIVTTDINGKATTKFTASAGRTGKTIVTAKSRMVSESTTSGTVFGRATVTVVMSSIEKH